MKRNILNTFSLKGKNIRAGGILPYIPSVSDCDEGGFFFNIEEKDEKEYLNDFGGKYRPEDCDIFRTIVREFSEETYNLYEINYQKIKKEKRFLIDCSNAKSALKGNAKREMYYICILHSDLSIQFDNETIKKKRKKVISKNPDIPSYFYKTVGVKFLTFTQTYIEFINNNEIFDGRMIKILESIFKSFSIENKEMCKEIIFPLDKLHIDEKSQ